MKTTNAILGAGRIMKEVTIVATNKDMLKIQFIGPFFVENTDVVVASEGRKFGATIRLIKDGIAILKVHKTSALYWEECYSVNHGA